MIHQAMDEHLNASAFFNQRLPKFLEGKGFKFDQLNQSFSISPDSITNHTPTTPLQTVEASHSSEPYTPQTF